MLTKNEIFDLTILVDSKMKSVWISDERWLKMFSPVVALTHQKHLHCSQSPTNFPVRSFEIERFKLRAAILDECQTYLGVALNPNVHPLGTYKTKMAFHTSKRSILTILRNEKMGTMNRKIILMKICQWNLSLINKWKMTFTLKKELFDVWSSGYYMSNNQTTRCCIQTH